MSKARKPSHKKAPFHRATPSRNIVFLDNGAVTRRASLSRQLPTHTSGSGEYSTTEPVSPNAVAHAVGLGNQVDGFPTSHLRTTFNTSSPFVHAPLPPPNSPLRAGTTDTRIQLPSGATTTTREPTVFSWHMEDEEAAARGYEGLKLGDRSMKSQGSRKLSKPPFSDQLHAPTPAAGPVVPRESSSASDRAETITVLPDPVTPIRTLRSRTVRQTTTRAPKGKNAETHSARTLRRKRKSVIADENTPSPKKADPRVCAPSPYGGSTRASVEAPTNDELAKPSKVLKRKRTSRTLARAEYLANEDDSVAEVQSIAGDVDICAVDPAAAPEAASVLADLHTSNGLETEATSSPPRPSKRRSKRTRALRGRANAQPARETAGGPDEETATAADAVRVQKLVSPDAEDSGDDDAGHGDDGGAKHRKRQRLEDARDHLQESTGAVSTESQQEADIDIGEDQGPEMEMLEDSSTTTQVPQLASDAGVRRCSPQEDAAGSCEDSGGHTRAGPVDDLAAVVSAGYSGPQGHGASEVGAFNGCAEMEDDHPRAVSISEELKLSAGPPSGSVQDIAHAFTPPATEDLAEKDVKPPANEDPSADLGICVTLLASAHQENEPTATASPPRVPLPEPQQSHFDSDGGAVDFDMEAALDVMLSGGQLNEAQLAALQPHIIGATSGWDVSAADAASLDLETHIPDLALADWDMEELLRDSAGCMLGLEDYLAHSAAHTTTPADLSETMPTLEALELDMLGLAEHLLPLVDLEAPSVDSDAVASLGLDLHFDLAAPSLDVTGGALGVSVGNCEAALSVGGGFGFERLGLVAVDPTMFESHSEAVLPQLGLDSGALCLHLGIEQPHSIDTPRTTMPGDDDPSVPQARLNATPRQSTLLTDAQEPTLSGAGILRLRAQSEDPPSAPRLATNNLLAGSTLVASVATVTSADLSFPTVGGMMQYPPPSSSSAIRPSAPPIPSTSASPVSTAQPSLSPPRPMAPRMQPIALPPPSSVRTARAVSPQPVLASSPAAGPAENVAASASNQPSDVAPHAEAAWSTMFRQLKQTKKSMPVRRRVGVLRKYEEGREYWHGDAGEFPFEDTTEKDGVQEVSQGSPASTLDAVTPSTEEKDEQPANPEVIVIVDSEDEEPHVGKELYRCPICARRFKLPNGLAIHLKWHYGETSLDWKRGISKNGRILERAKEAKESAAARARELAQSSNAAPSLQGSTSTEPHPDIEMCISPTPQPASMTPSPGASSMPFIPVSVSNDPFDSLVSRQRDAASMSPDSDLAAPPPPIHAAAIDINVGTGARKQSELLSTPGLSVGPSRCNDEAVVDSTQPSWSDDLFGSEADPSEAEMDECTNVTTQVDPPTTDTNIVRPNGEKCHGNSGRGLELGLSPLSGFASLQLLQ